MSSRAAESRTATLAGHGGILVQLALILFIVHRYDVATRHHLFPVLAATVAGYAVRLALPARLRLPFFGLLSCGGILAILGWPGGALVLGIGTGLIALARLPVAFPIRIALIGLAALALSGLRLDYAETFWPVLGSMFMFRMILYVREVRSDDRSPPAPLTVAYFFPLQNLSFLFFPIVDFKTFRETYRPEAAWQDAQRGIEFLGRGLSHILAYRAVKYYLLPTPQELNDLPSLALFVAANYALYLHVSGYFHLITGIFHLFGFALPRTHHNYFLASSFTDIWRRINIPWKEFMAKVFFFPAFFALRRFGDGAAVVLAAMWVFLMTWLLHAYQVFWIVGRLPLNGYDAILWLSVGVLVAANLLWDLKRAGRPRRPAGRSVWSAVAHSARVVGMFTLVGVFWACWNTPWFVGLVRIQARLGHGFAGGDLVLAVLGGLIVLGAAVKLIEYRMIRSVSPSPSWSGAAHLVLLAAVAVLSVPDVAAVFGPAVSRRIGELRRDSLTSVEAALATQGYYEEIADVPVRAGAWFSELEGRPQPRQQTHYSDLSRPTDDLLERELIPNWSGELLGSPLTINPLGMRDRPDRSIEAPPGTRRIAVVGSSIVMGYGVRDDETFVRLLEDRLNDGLPAGNVRTEVLNFGTGKSFAIHRRALIDRKVFNFKPDAIYVVGHQDEYRGAVDHLAKLIANGNALPYPSLREVAAKAGVTAETPWGESQARLRPFGREIVAGVYRELVAECRRRDVLAVWVYLPVPGIAEPPGYSDELVRTAEEAGFVTVNLAGWYGDRRTADVNVTAADHHPNAVGHGLIADRLAEEIRKRPELLPLNRPGGPR